MNILCATDLLPKSDAAVERAGMLADQLTTDLTLLHVVVPSASERALEETLHTALAHMRSRAQRPVVAGKAFARCGRSRRQPSTHHLRDAGPIEAAPSGTRPAPQAPAPGRA